MNNLKRGEEPRVGLRERKKYETRMRITEQGIALFLQNGIDQTTLDEIAAAAGISRRTFFYYFSSKDEILLSMLNRMGEMLTEAVRKAQPLTPMAAARDAVFSVCETIPSGEMVELDRLMRTSASVQARKQAFYVQLEGEIYAALKERWPAPGQSTSLRMIAMTSVGALRLAGELFHQEEGARDFTEILEELFNYIDKQG